MYHVLRKTDNNYYQGRPLKPSRSNTTSWTFLCLLYSN